MKIAVAKPFEIPQDKKDALQRARRIEWASLAALDLREQHELLIHLRGKLVGTDRAPLALNGVPPAAITHDTTNRPATHAPSKQMSVLAGQSLSTVQARPGWSELAAVKNKRVVAVDDSVASRWGPRIVDLARAIAKVAKHS